MHVHTHNCYIPENPVPQQLGFEWTWPFVNQCLSLLNKQLSKIASMNISFEAFMANKCDQLFLCSQPCLSRGNGFPVF